MIAISMVGIAYADNNGPSYYSLLNSWTGLYVGADAGLSFNKAQLRSQQLGFTNPANNCNTSSSYSTFFPGIQLGYMHQFPNYFVSGIEANVTINTNQQDILSCNSNINPNVYDRFTFTNRAQASIKARAGRALDWNKGLLLPYLMAGASFANVGLTYKNEGGDYYSKNTIQPGWLVGVGVEWAFWKRWSLRAEYSYVNYVNTIKMDMPTVYGLIDINGKAHVYLSSNNVALALNYWI